MKVGYCVSIAPHLASYRLRVAIPAPLLGCDYEIGTIGNPSFFYKHTEGDVELAHSIGRTYSYVYDVVNDHFTGTHKAHYQAMCDKAAIITCSSETMAEAIKKHTGREATVIDDPYENEEQKPECEGNEVLWLGHSANISSLFNVVAKIEDLPILLAVCTNYKHPEAILWSQDSERRSIERCALMLVTGNNPGASSNRIVKALRAGRFVVTPGGASAWQELERFIWIGDVREGVKWAFANREEACAKILAGQEYLRERNHPRTIAAQWTEAFASISAPDTSGSRDGSRSIMLTATATS